MGGPGLREPGSYERERRHFADAKRGTTTGPTGTRLAAHRNRHHSPTPHERKLSTHRRNISTYVQSTICGYTSTDIPSTQNAGGIKEWCDWLLRAAFVFIEIRRAGHLPAFRFIFNSIRRPTAPRRTRSKSPPGTVAWRPVATSTTIVSPEGSWPTWKFKLLCNP